MPHITRELLRKRAEHNEGMISTLEELSLHQEELEGINEVLAKTCRKIKILYLQNNIIPRIENLQHMKDLEYLNLALNNITRIEGLGNCEFLRKLDLTVNFIDFDTLRYSIEHLADRENLQELYMMGNPAAASWPAFTSYVIAKLPQLTVLDGTEITRSMRILAMQSLPKMELELFQLAEGLRMSRAAKAGAVVEELGDDPDQMTENTPEVRIKIYQELAQQKKEKEDRGNVNAPRPRDYEAEQAEAIAKARAKEAEDEREIKQKNEGAWEFFWDEETLPGYVQLEVRVARYLDSSLIDVDIHPHFLSMVIKSKVLRLRLPAEVLAGQSKCQRSKSTGALLVIMPKANAKENEVTIRGDIRHRQQQTATMPTVTSMKQQAKKKVEDANRTRIKSTKTLSLQEQMMQEASMQEQLASIVKQAPQPVLVEERAEPASSKKMVSIEELD